MLRAVQQWAATRPAAATAAGLPGGARPYSSAALAWLERFVNYERRGVPAAAGTDSDAGFDLVRSPGLEWQCSPSHLQQVACSATPLCLHRTSAAAPPVCPVLQGRMRRLLADLGDPQAAWPAAVHVAGTKGKGSTVAMLAAILRAAGYKAGAYTRCGGSRGYLHGSCSNQH